MRPIIPFYSIGHGESATFFTLHVTRTTSSFLFPYFFPHHPTKYYLEADRQKCLMRIMAGHWCFDRFLTVSNCFPATALLNREFLTKTICFPSIFIPWFLNKNLPLQQQTNKRMWGPSLFSWPDVIHFAKTLLCC